ncbi:MAG: hypothetical protein H6720_30415 [Sandaracinus sp.]|nr:hypothetical protein [Sandaracinus sp.]
MRLSFPLVLSTLLATGALAQPARQGTPHFWPEGAEPPPGAELRAPAELAGFRFDWNATRARRACVSAGHAWSQEGSLARCEGAARDPGFSAHVTLRFCGGRVCEITAEHADANGWGGAYRVALQALRGAFGREQNGRFRGADDACVAELEAGRDGACFRRDGQARHYWVAGGSELELRLERAIGASSPTLRVTFRGATRVREIDIASN